MDPKIFIFIIIIAVVVFFIIKSNFKIKDTVSKPNSILKQPKQSFDELTFLNKDYEKEKLKELKYITAQQEQSDDDINSQDLL